MKDRKCTWVRAFDQNFNISCVEDNGMRANGQFRGKAIGAKWEFKYCPYCGREIEEFKPVDTTTEDSEGI